MDNLLETLGREGVLDSSGRFTLAPAAALEKLRTYRLVDPQAYVLCLIMAAVAGGASAVSVRVGPAEVVVEDDGPPLALGDLQELLSRLPEQHASPRLRELATGIQAVLPGRVVVESGPHRLAVEADSLRWEERPDEPRTVVRVPRRLPWGKRLKAARAGFPEVALVRQRCAWSPVPVTVNGELVPPTLAPRLGWVRLEGQVSLPGQPGPPRRVEPGPDGGSAVLAVPCYRRGPHREPLFPEGGDEHPSLLILVFHGVAFARLCPALGWATMAVASHPGLRLNLSRTDVLEDDVYRELVAALAREAASLRGQVWQEAVTQPGRHGASELFLRSAFHGYHRGGWLERSLATLGPAPTGKWPGELPAALWAQMGRYRELAELLPLRPRVRAPEASDPLQVPLLTAAGYLHEAEVHARARWEGAWQPTGALRYRACLDLAGVLRAQNRLEAAVQLVRTTLDPGLAPWAPVEEKPLQQMLRDQLAQLLGELGRWPEALELPELSPATLAWASFHVGRPEEIAGHHLTVAQKLGAGHPEAVALRTLQAVAEGDAAALAVCRDQYAERLGAHHLDVALVECERVALLTGIRAREEGLRAAGLLSELLGADHPRVLWALTRLGPPDASLRHRCAQAAERNGPVYRVRRLTVGRPAAWWNFGESAGEGPPLPAIDGVVELTTVLEWGHL